ncbi:hypothetical protein LZ31DRAFT_557093 [Colletotrichum somersetense]|nr:hypothetical protein LZ31DRAFT_557093 [Colletotrichum somersetense]
MRSVVPQFKSLCYRPSEFDILPTFAPHRCDPLVSYSWFPELRRPLLQRIRARLSRAHRCRRNISTRRPTPFPSHVQLFDLPRPAAPIQVLVAIPVLRLELRETPEEPCSAYRRKSRPAPYASRRPLA